MHYSSAHQEGITDEEDGRVVAREVPVALLGVELQREAPGIADGIRRARLPGWG